MTITMHRCQCHELSSGLCAACEVQLADELHALENAQHDYNRSRFDQLVPPNGDEVWPL